MRVSVSLVSSLSVGLALDELSEDVLEDTTVLVVGDLNICVESGLDLEGLAGVSRYIENFVDLEVAFLQVDVEGFSTSQSKRVSVLAAQEFSRENTHTDQVRSVDSLVALSNDGLDSLEVGSPKKGRRLEKVILHIVITWQPNHEKILNRTPVQRG